MGQFGLGSIKDINPKRIIDLENEYAVNIIQSMECGL